MAGAGFARNCPHVIGNPRAKDHGFKERIRRQPVGAVQAGRSHFANRPKALHAGAAAFVGCDAAHVIVLGGRNRYQIFDGINADRFAQRRDSRIGSIKLCPNGSAAIEIGAAPGHNLRKYTARHDIA